jgi:hypothetical protein
MLKATEIPDVDYTKLNATSEGESSNVISLPESASEVERRWLVSLLGASKSPCTHAGCSDAYAKCPVWAAMNFCAAQWFVEGLSVPSQACRLSCGVCGDPYTKCNLPEDGGGCKCDSDGNCLGVEIPAEARKATGESLGRQMDGSSQAIPHK